MGGPKSTRGGAAAARSKSGRAVRDVLSVSATKQVSRIAIDERSEEPWVRAPKAIDQSGVIPSALGGAEDDAPSTEQNQVVEPRSMRTARRPALMMMAGDGAGRVIRIDGDRTTVGRSKRATVELRDNGVSRLHCAITHQKSDRWLIEDLESTNGTLVNGGRVSATKRVELSAGDRIQLGPEVVLQFGFFDDAEESLAMKLYEAATRDPLTRAHNRRYLTERLSAEVSYATRHAQKLIAVMFDIDHFKRVNDTHGHVVGDAVLREVTYAVIQTLRNEDVLARYGGEEFVVLARGLTLKQGAQLGERIRSALEERSIVAEGRRLKVTISAGVAALDECAKPGGGVLLALADSRLYRAKQIGRNRIVAK